MTRARRASAGLPVTPFADMLGMASTSANAFADVDTTTLAAHDINATAASEPPTHLTSDYVEMAYLSIMITIGVPLNVYVLAGRLLRLYVVSCATRIARKHFARRLHTPGIIRTTNRDMSSPEVLITDVSVD